MSKTNIPKFLMSAFNMVKRGDIKSLDDLFKFAKQEFGEITSSLRNQIEDVFTKGKAAAVTETRTKDMMRGDVTGEKKEGLISLTKELEQNLNNAFKLAQDQKHEFVTVEHLLLALLENTDAVALLSSNKVNIEQLRVDLQEFIGSTTPKISSETEIDIQPTLGFQRVIPRAVFHVQSSGKSEVKGSNVLVAIFSEKESQSVYLLQQQGLTRLDAVTYLSCLLYTSPSPRDLSTSRMPSSA